MIHIFFHTLLLSTVFFGLYPSELTPQKGCEIWVGTSSGNDPSVRVELSVCLKEKDEVDGILQWSSEKSGWNRRAIVGRYVDSANKELLLHDTGFIENKPNFPWSFCLIDEYHLTRSGNILKGWYYSSACKDRATLSLSLRKEATTK